MSDRMRVIHRSPDGRMEVSTNIPGFRWPSTEEKIAGLLSAGIIDEQQAAAYREKYLK